MIRTVDSMSSELSDVNAAIKELRKAQLKDSVAAFGARLRVSVRTIANYEKNRTPETPVLVKMMQIADAEGRTDLGSIFQISIERQIGYPIFRCRPDEAEAVDALIAILRIDADSEDRRELLTILRPFIECAKRDKESSIAVASAVKAIRIRAAAGDSDDQIIAAFPIFSPEVIRIEAADERWKIRRRSCEPPVATLAAHD